MYNLPTKEQLLAAGAPYGKILKGTPIGNDATEWLRTRPDTVVYIPSTPEEFGNEIVQVVEVPGRNCLFAVWHQDAVENTPDMRIMYSRSGDGEVWESPRRLAGTWPGEENTRSAFVPTLIATLSGRVYVFYGQHTEKTDPVSFTRRISAPLVCRYTDDCGETWSEPAQIPRPQTPWEPLDNADNKSMTMLQNPIRLADGRYFGAWTQLVEDAVISWKNLGVCDVPDTHCYFCIFENIADDPEPGELKITWLPDDPNGLCLQPDDPYYSKAEEPFVVQLPNGWLFASLRTYKGCIYYTVSEDLGHTWRKPKPMQFADGRVFANPAATPFLCDYGDGRYMQLFYNRWEGRLSDMFEFRDKLYRAFGTFAPEDEQPIRFDEKEELVAQLEVGAGPRIWADPEISLEASFTRFNGVPMLWYGDRKHYVLGKKI